MKRWLNSPLLPVFAAVACLAPFARKAFNVDDPLFLWAARQIVHAPQRAAVDGVRVEDDHIASESGSQPPAIVQPEHIRGAGGQEPHSRLEGEHLLFPHPVSQLKFVTLVDMLDRHGAPAPNP